MPDTQISEEMVDAFIAAFNSGVFDRPAFNLPVDERCRCGQCLQEEADARSTVRAALEAALFGHVVGGLTEQQIIERERQRCAQICERWIATFKDTNIQYTSARDYAVDAINDIIEMEG